MPIVTRRAKRHYVCPGFRRVGGCANIMRTHGFRMFHRQLTGGNVLRRTGSFFQTAKTRAILRCGRMGRSLLHAHGSNNFRLLKLTSFPKRNDTFMNVLSTF